MSGLGLFIGEGHEGGLRGFGWRSIVERGHRVAGGFEAAIARIWDGRLMRGKVSVCPPQVNMTGFEVEFRAILR
jgi:hypothetical protein